MGFRVFNTIYNSRDMIKLLEIYHLVLMLEMCSLKNEKIFEEKGTKSMSIKCFYLVCYSLSKGVFFATRP